MTAQDCTEQRLHDWHHEVQKMIEDHRKQVEVLLREFLDELRARTGPLPSLTVCRDYHEEKLPVISPK